MKATPEGVFARTLWTDRARGMIAAKEYRHISPVIVYDKATREVGRILGAGLVHRPNLQLQALHAQDAPGAPMQPQPEPAKAVAAMLDMLGLTPEATATGGITALLGRVTKQPPQTGAAPRAQGGPEALALGIPDPARLMSRSPP